MSKALATKNVATALIGLGVVVAFAFSFASTVKADTVSDLQSQVQTLLAQISALQGSSSTTGSGTGFTFTQNLQVGSKGAEVLQLQKFLNSHGAVIAKTGAGSAGNETSSFGPATKKAVMAFQSANGITPASGYWGPLTRSKANSLGGGTTTGGTTTGGTTVPTGPGITVAAAAQPANSLAPKGAQRVPFTTFTITNNTGSAVTINGVTVQRTGLGQDAAFAGIALVDSNGVQVGISKTLNSNHQTTVGDTWTIQAGQTQTLTIAGNMNTDLSSYTGQVVSLTVVGINTSVPVNGSLPITGASQTLNNSLAVGTVTAVISSFDPNAAQTKNIGDTGVKFTGIRFTAGSAEDLKFYSIRFRLNGSVSAGDLANVVTIVDGTSYPATVSADGRYYTTVFPGGILVPKGNSTEVYIQGDIVGSNASGRVVEFDIDKQSDVYFVGQLYSYGVSFPYNASGSISSNSTHATTYASSGNPIFQGSTFSITGASVTGVSKATEVPAQNVAVNVSNQPLGGYVVDLKGESVSVQSQVFYIATSSNAGSGLLTSVSLVDENGSVVAGPVDAIRYSDTQQKVTFTDTVTYKTGRHVYTIKGKLPSGLANGGTLIVTTNPSSDWTNVTGQTTGNSISFPNSLVTMNTMTVRAASLAVTVSNQPTAQNVVAGGSILFGNVQLDAGQSGEDLRISSIPLRLVLATAADKSYLSSCQFYDGTTALNTGSNVKAPSALNADTTSSTTGLNNFTFDNSLVITKGTVKTLAFKCNLLTGITAGASHTIATAVGADTWTVTGVTSGNTLSGSSLTITPGTSGAMTPAAGSLTVSTDASSPSYTVAAGGSTGVTVGVFKFRAANEALSLNKLGLQLNTASTSASDLNQVTIWDGATQVGTATFTGNGSIATSTFATAVTLPKDTDKVLTIKADLASIGTSQSGTEGHLVIVNYNSADTTGQSSGTNVQGSGSTSVSGVRTFKTFPTISLDTLPTSGVADGRLIHFKVTANSAGPVGIAQFNFSIATSTITSVTAINMYGFTGSDYSQPISGVGTGGLVNAAAQSAPTGTFTITPSSFIQVPAGSTYYFEVRGTVAGVQTGSSVSTTLLGDSAYPSLASFMSNSTISGSNLIWSPNATSTAVAASNDWTNGYGLAGLPGSGIVSTRSN